MSPVQPESNPCCCRPAHWDGSNGLRRLQGPHRLPGPRSISPTRRRIHCGPSRHRPMRRRSQSGTARHSIPKPPRCLPTPCCARSPDCLPTAMAPWMGSTSSIPRSLIASCMTGTTLRAHARFATPCRAGSRKCATVRPMHWPWSTRPSRSPMQSSTGAPPGLPHACVRKASWLAMWWQSPWSVRRGPWSRCWPRSRRVPVTCRWTFRSPRSGSPSPRTTTACTEAGRDGGAAGFASRLRAEGVVAGDVGAVARERSGGAVVAVLATLKAGAGYLPLDVSQPEERLAFTLDDAGVRVALLDCAQRDLLPKRTLCRIVVDDGSDSIEADANADADADANAGIDGDALAYVMYTSGSTGTPKGVEIRHRSILRLVCDVDYIELGSRTRMLHAAPLGFDASTLELCGPLLNGGCVVVHDEPLPTGAGLEATIRRHGVTTARLTAALFNAVVDEDPRRLSGLQELFTGGEALSVDHVRRMRGAAPGVALHNGYGPTECTTFTCTHRIDDVPAGATSIPIGRPIADTSVYILNSRGEPVPTGVVGELHVGGEGVARGYLGRTDLTAERFVPDAFGPPDGRLYRTGDRVRYLPDGSIEFVGRADHQVKIRGFRIEPGEIEATLAGHAGVKSCAVIARDDSVGGKQLVAYYVCQGEAPTAPSLRAFLAAALPDFMVPARYVLLDAMPVTANGKLDRRALPAPERGRPELAVAYEPAVDALEPALCQAFAEPLDVDRTGRHAHLLVPGGSSLLTLKRAARIRALPGVRKGGL